MICWDIAGATFNLKDNRVHVYKPLCIFINKCFEHITFTFICRKVLNRFNLEKKFPPINFENISSVVGSEY